MAYDVVVIRYGKQTNFNFEDSWKNMSNSTMRSILPSDQKNLIDNSFEISTSQSMHLGICTFEGQATMHAMAMPRCALVHQDCRMHPLLEQVDFQPNLRDVITMENY